MNTILIIPTGVGAEIGGHAGDGNPVAKLIASVSDTLITHPNVVNASDINEMTENTWYVEGSMLDRFIAGEIELRQPSYNKILVVVNAPVKNETINSVSAARATIGCDASIVELETPLKLLAGIVDGKADGIVEGWEELVEQVRREDFDALAITTPIEIDKELAMVYLNKGGGVNPWGGVEAKASKLISKMLNKPVAHAPCGHTVDGFNDVVDPRLAAEMVSVSYLHCVLKGLHQAPRIAPKVNSMRHMSIADIDVIVTPSTCYRNELVECVNRGIVVIGVDENTVEVGRRGSPEFTRVDNYLEAAGLIAALRVGLHWPSVRRPLDRTEVT